MSDGTLSVVRSVPVDGAMQRPDTLTFTPRKESWVASSRGWFYKIFRASDEPIRDWLDPACGARAAREYADMLFLRGIDQGVCHPARLDHACIVYPHLSGPDLRVLLRGHAAGSPASTAALCTAVTLLARLHATPPPERSYPARDYAHGVYVRPSASIAARIAARERTLLVGGFEVRNFRFDRARDRWFFFDPQHVRTGMPEDGLARFIVSLLMVNWGRGGALKVWQGFAARDLLAAYEAASAHRVDRALLAYFLRDNVAMRRSFAQKALRAMRGARRVFGHLYLGSYFRQLDHWVANHEF